MRTIVPLFLLLVPALAARGQDMINTSTPFNQIGSSFFENNGVNWSLQGPNFFANFNGAATPPFGNFDPNSGLRTGIGFGNGNVRGSLGLSLGQGSNRSITSTTPSITTMNGVPGSITSQTIRPFVTGITPIVGDYPTFGSAPGQEASRSIQQAQQADLQQRMFKSNQIKQDKALAYFNRGQKAEAEGNKKMARANYRLALGSAEGFLRMEVIKRIRANGWAR